MKIISWNVNSIRARIENFINVAKMYSPDVFLLQETRVEDKSFPFYLLEDLGYNVKIKGQKARNGVAIFSKHMIDEIEIDSDFCCGESRVLAAFTGGINLLSIYVPNGQEIDSPAYLYKLDFLKSLQQLFDDYKNELFVAGGDFNVAPYPCDTHIDGYQGVSCTEKERVLVKKIRDSGFVDVLSSCGYTWWDYRLNGFAKNRGFRIDHFYLSQQTHQIYQSGGVLRDVRSQTKPSDHAPIYIELNLN